MRLGEPIFFEGDSPEQWVRAVQALGYRAAYCPLSPDASDETVRAFARAAHEADIVVAEVGAWSNPLSSNDDERRAAIETCERGLDLAERIGARCCVNIAGTRGANTDEPHPANLSDETFDMIVETARAVIDAVRPTRTFWTLETMPWIFPDSPQSYLRLLQAIDRPQFGVHFDPVNLINCPARYFDTTGFLRECFALLGPHIRSCHAKDILLHPQLTVHLDEVRPGLGGLDYAAFLRELERLDPDTPLMLEHLESAEEYRAAAQHIRSVAHQEGLSL